MTRALLLAAMLLAACDREAPRAPGEPAPSPAVAEAVDARPPGNPDRSADAHPPGPTCERRLADLLARLDEAYSELRVCRWDVDCVLLPIETRCCSTCPTAVSSAGVVRARAAVTGIDADLCEAFLRDGCTVSRADCVPLVATCRDGACTTRSEVAADRHEIEIPPQNAHGLTESPPRPPPGDAEERAQRLFDAIVHDDPDRVLDFFFPREAFLVLKGIAGAGAYWDRLFARYRQDIHALHETTPDLDRADFVRLDLVQRGGWVAVREEGNRLPYWASRHSFIHYRVGDEERRLEVRVLITWGERWYVIHLNEFH